MVELERENPTSVNWSHEHYEGLFRTTAPELSRYFVLVAEDPYESKNMIVSATALPIVGYLAALCVDRFWELQYVVVAKEFRRRSVGTSLVSEFISHVRATGGSRIFLEVRESNEGARRMYNTLGFEETGLRKRYYADPLEDAILCRLRL
jgi:ribosomal-protein-alanine N-acetyltransferase